MDTQSASVHIRLWHKNFWLLIIVNLLLCISVTMLIPTMPRWLLLKDGISEMETGIVMGSFAIGLFLPGAFCSYLVQRYRRNLVCVWAILLMALSIVLPLYVSLKGLLLPIILLRLLQGASFGLAQMVLTSTLIIDTCESFQRTKANHSVTWFGRFALSMGPMLGILINRFFDFDYVLGISASCCLVAAVLVLLVHFPFRVPSDDVHVLSLDRFFLTSGWLLFVHLFLVSLSVGMLFSLPLNDQFYALLMVGFLLALLAQRFIFPNAELKSEVVSGLILMGASMLILLTSPSSLLQAPLLGLGIGIVGARFLLFLIKLSKHCRRGTSQSTFMLGWESGLAFGVGIGYTCFSDDSKKLVYTALAIVAGLLISYLFFLHNWFLQNKNR